MIIKSEFLKYGRSSWLPMLVIFYNAILAFFTILLLYFRTESDQGIIYYSTSPYLQQFLIVSSIQIFLTFIIVPCTFSTMYMLDKQNHIQEQLALIPRTVNLYLYAKCAATVAVNMVLFLSSVPILSLSCIYSDVSFFKLFRVGGIIFLFSLWSVALTAFIHVIWRYDGGAVIATVLFEILFCSGGIFLVSMVGNYYASIPDSGDVPKGVAYFCVLVLFLNPISAYMGYYGNLTGNIGIMSRLCGMIGIDTTKVVFSALFYKGATLILLISAFAMLIIAGKLMIRRWTMIHLL